MENYNKKKLIHESETRDFFLKKQWQFYFVEKGNLFSDIVHAIWMNGIADDYDNIHRKQMINRDFFGMLYMLFDAYCSSKIQRMFLVR